MLVTLRETAVKEQEVAISQAIGMAVKQVSDRHRYTYLAKRLAKFADTLPEDP